ncbi:G-alpha-domain-containing protein [Dentipellis sp. KUC8613]|nr:G-alpha-domain-containing protein [Dentipellis sp. KUC8613]
MAPVASITDRDDPLTRALAPPPDETPEARDVRLRAEAEARKHSDMIDEELNQERLAAKKSPKPVKILLLGALLTQRCRDAGKSTTLKNFQLMASPKAFKTERIVWRAVIQLNVVRSIHLVLDTLADLHAQQLGRPSSSPAPAGPLPELTPEHLRLKMRLSPLLQVEETLVRKLSARGLGSERDREVSVSGSGWKGRFGRIMGGVEAARSSVESARTHSRTPSLRSRAQSRAGVEGEDDSGIDWDDPEDPGRVIHACGEDMMKLWADPVIRRALEMQKMRLQEMSGFFLDSLDRVAQLRYIPTDDDILRARIKTLGVTEYRFTLNQKNSMVSRDWVVFDVGGHRSLVPAWVPYFDDMNAIIFLAPISCFDQVLEEDERVNRLEDSVLLWNTIVANPLLARTTMVLFLNKCDILREKLDAGIQFGRYITSYGDRPNDFESTSNYLKRKFTAVHKEKSPSPRPYYCHLTSVTDTKTTALILWDVAESILRVNLEKSALIV